MVTFIIDKVLEERSFKDLSLHVRKYTTTQGSCRQVPTKEKPDGAKQRMFSFCSQTLYLTLCGRSNEWEERPRMLLHLKFLYMGKCRKENKHLPHPFTFQVLSRTNSQSPFLPILPYALLHKRRHRGSLLALNATFTLSELFFIAFILSCKCNN